MLSDWPKAKEEYDFAADEAAMTEVMELISGIRNVRAELNVPPSKRTHITVVTDEAKVDVFSAVADYLKKLAYAETVSVQTDKSGVADDAVSAVSAAATAYMPLAELVDIEKELARLEKEKANCLAEIARAEGKLNNQGFVSKAPAKVVDDVRAALIKNQELLAKISERMEKLSK